MTQTVLDRGNREDPKQSGRLRGGGRPELGRKGKMIRNENEREAVQRELGPDGLPDTRPDLIIVKTAVTIFSVC